METIWDEFVVRDLALAGGVVFQGKLVSAIVVAIFGKSCYYWLGFNSKPQAVPGAANLAMWEMIKLCKERGLQLFEMGSVEFEVGKQKNISRFKESFNGQPSYALGGILNVRPYRNVVIQTAEATVDMLRNRD